MHLYINNEFHLLTTNKIDKDTTILFTNTFVTADNHLKATCHIIGH